MRYGSPAAIEKFLVAINLDQCLLNWNALRSKGFGACLFKVFCP